ncbi:hypothetical protein GOP47_0012949 [Adiantum capillus-veneris]|uniref:Uncharacterized protein n=1 Tax=Adiantum capillus-veneris TaxID=13818 RepID=A0A9D4UT11_ADICA|nr:hypothetical protein GOP47_0012949 [Adiantum capillus-veneris]
MRMRQAVKQHRGHIEGEELQSGMRMRVMGPDLMMKMMRSINIDESAPHGHGEQQQQSMEEEGEEDDEPDEGSQGDCCCHEQNYGYSSGRHIEGAGCRFPSLVYYCNIII